MFTKIMAAANHKRKSFRISVAAVAVLFICSVTITAFATADAYTAVTVTDGDKTVTVTTKSTDAHEIALEADMAVGANDELDLSDYTPGEGGTIAIDRAKVVKVQDDNSIAYYVGYGTLGEVFDEQGVTVSPDDAILASLNEPVIDGMKVTIRRAFAVTITADGEKTTVYLTNGTVAAALEKAGIQVDDDDIVAPKLATVLTDSVDVSVKRVEYIERSETKEIPYKTVTVPAGNMYVDESSVTTKGVNGSAECTYTDKFVDGVLEASTLTDEKVVKAAVDEVKKVGTRKRLTLIEFKDGLEPISELEVPEYVKLDENGLPTEYKEVFEGKATAYTGDPATASGRKPMPGHVAVNPAQFPYGTELYIVSLDGNYIYGYSIAADTGGFVKMGNTDLDLYLENEEMCDQWGNRGVRVYVL